MDVIQTTFPCGDSTSTVATVCIPPETLDECADRHDIAVAAGKEACQSTFAGLGGYQTTWIADVGTMLYASDTSQGQVHHDRGVAILQARYPISS